MKNKLFKLIEWIIYMILSTLAFILISNCFKTIYINTDHIIIFGFLISIVIYIINKTIKPALVTITMPLIGMTAGLFYPFINLFILYLADWIFKSNFQIKNFWIGLFFAILLSIANLITTGIMKELKKKANIK
jgi:hypothetical protein